MISGALRDGLNLIIVGPTGVGKTWLACALAHGDGRFAKTDGELCKDRLADLGLLGLGAVYRYTTADMLELLDDRYGGWRYVMMTESGARRNTDLHL